MSGNIVLIGLRYDNNLGDRAIFESTYAMVRSAAGEGTEIRCADLYGRCAPEKYLYKEEFFHKYKLKVLRRMMRYLKVKDAKEKLKRIDIADVCRYLCRDNIDRDTRAVIFAGGGIIKFRYQNFHNYIAEVLKHCDRRRVPVMFSGVGVEGYDAMHPDCRLLQKALDRRCVKCITTRDDLELLKNGYRPKYARLWKVADPACSLGAILPAEKRKNAVPVIGLGVVREGLFTDNGIDFGADEMLAYWKEAYRAVKGAGCECRLFCNGARSDDAFAGKLLEELGIPEEERKTVYGGRPESTEKLVNTISSFDAVISGRLHAAILAYAYGVPAVGLVWNAKQKMFGEATGYPERFIDVKTVTAEQAAETAVKIAGTAYERIDNGAYRASTEAAIREFLEREAKS